MKSWPVGTPDVYTSWLPIGSRVEPWLPCNRRSPNRRITNLKSCSWRDFWKSPYRASSTQKVRCGGFCNALQAEFCCGYGCPCLRSTREEDASTVVSQRCFGSRNNGFPCLGRTRDENVKTSGGLRGTGWTGNGCPCLGGSGGVVVENDAMASECACTAVPSVPPAPCIHRRPEDPR